MSKFLTKIPPPKGQAGHFRIGDVILQIAPEQIQCHKVINNQEIMPLRFPFSIPIKTGQSRWDVTWSWKALADRSISPPDYSQWKDLQRILAMFKSAPFVEVENDHLRQIMFANPIVAGTTSDDRMAFALRQLRVDTIPDITDGLQLTVTMSLFNYKPYSTTFAYDDGNGDPASASHSPIFSAYLDKWITTNLDNDPTQLLDGEDAASNTDWINSIPGTTEFTWREYKAISLAPNPPITNSAGSITGTTPSTSAPKKKSKGSSSILPVGGYVDNVIITDFTPSNPQISTLVQALQTAEGAGYNVPAKPIGVSSAFGIIQWIATSAIIALQASDVLLNTNYISAAVQAGRLLNQTGKQYKWSNASVSNPLSNTPYIANYWDWMNNPIGSNSMTMQNNMATAWVIKLLKQFNGHVLSMLQSDRGASPAEDPRWWNTVIDIWHKVFPATANKDFVINLSTSTVSSIPAISTSVPSLSASIAPASTINTGTNTIPQENPSAIQQQIQTIVDNNLQVKSLLIQGWLIDYFTESSIYLYRPHIIKLVDEEHGDSPDEQLVDINLHTNQISVVFLNNFAQLPLDAYQYPTYQHIGPASSLVSVGFLSLGQTNMSVDTYAEPFHQGLAAVSEMITDLENQYIDLRNEWRKTTSVHRMQVVSVNNQVLNMLGIHGLLTKELTTETVPESPNMVSAQFIATQYENVFEEIGPYRVQAVPQDGNATWLSILRSPSPNVLDSLNNSAMAPLVNLSHNMQVGNVPFIVNWLLNATHPSPPSDAYLVATPSAFTADEQTLMRNALTQINATQLVNVRSGLGIASGDAINPDIVAMIQSHNPLNYSDFIIISQLTINGNPYFSAIQQATVNINARIASALAANTSFQPLLGSTGKPIDILYNEYLKYITGSGNTGSTNTGNINNLLSQAELLPGLKSLFVTSTNTITPGLWHQNSDHGCYRDLGLDSIQGTTGLDLNPGVYFVDDSKVLQTSISQQSPTVANTIINTSNLFSATQQVPIGPSILKPGNNITSSPLASGDIQAIINKMQAPVYSMNRAFPTFKLFLLQDKNDKPYFAYDNFYSYATVKDIEIIRYRDRPDTAILQLTDLSHLLDNKVYDSTARGRLESGEQTPYFLKLPTNGEALTGPGESQAFINVSGTATNLSERFSEINSGGLTGDPIFPLKYFPLQPGSKIQVRMGFTNNPDELTPIFTGEVTEVERGEILTLTAQSYMLELMEHTADELKQDGFGIGRSLQGLINQIALLPTAAKTDFSTTPAYGGITLFGQSSGSAHDVISQLVKVSNGKHFGHWQIGETADPYVKGFTWSALGGSILNSIGATTGGNILSSAYDRSNENIMIDHLINIDSSATIDNNGVSRKWWFERTIGFLPPQYYVPKNPDLTPWSLISDISRRYPDYNLLVKQYGFPYTADSTLVFANPNDWYNTRLPMPGEIEHERVAATNDVLFNAWWKGGGITGSGRAKFIAFITGTGSTISGKVLTDFTGTTSIFNSLTNSSARDAETLASKIDSLGVTAFLKILDIYNDDLNSTAGQFFTSINPVAPSVQIVQQQLTSLRNSYLGYVKLVGAADTTFYPHDRIKPVRSTYFVNKDNIIHNGIVLNNEVINQVKISNYAFAANEGIPSHYRRVLNADGHIIDVDHNVVGGFEGQYAQSFLREELGKMYRGELVIIGRPEIEPGDVIILSDPSKSMVGPVEVDTIIHSFNQENGYISIIKPRVLVSVNDKLSAPWYVAVGDLFNSLQARIAPLLSGTANIGIGSDGLNTVITGGVVLFATTINQKLHTMYIHPITRYNRPWVAGVEGWSTQDIVSIYGQKVQRKYKEEIEPLIESYRAARSLLLQ